MERELKQELAKITFNFTEQDPAINLNQKVMRECDVIRLIEEGRLLDAQVILQGDGFDKKDIEKQIVANAERELNTAINNYDYQTAQFMLDTLRLYKFKQIPLSK